VLSVREELQYDHRDNTEQREPHGASPLLLLPSATTDQQPWPSMRSVAAGFIADASATRGKPESGRPNRGRCA
jgi:hypothetical protein